MTVYVYAELAGLWIEAGGPGSHAAVAAAIAEAESGGDSTRIYNTAYPNLPHYHPPTPGAQPEYSVGLWQINLVAHPSYTAAELLDPVFNAQAAVTISDGGASFSPWTTYTTGKYQRFVQANFTPTIPGPGGGVTSSGALSSSGPVSPQGIRAYADLRNAMAKHLPRQLDESRRLGLATLRVLGRRHKVRH